MNNTFPGKKPVKTKALQLLLLAALCAALGLCWVVGKKYEAGKMPKAPDAPVSEEELRTAFPVLAPTRADHETDIRDAIRTELSQQGEELLITGGDWILTGKMTGRICIAAEEQTVHLLLDGVELTSPEGPAVIVESAGKVIMTLADGSENTISDSGDYRKTQDMEACIYSEADLTINGTGALSVNGLYKDAIRSKNVVRVMNGQLLIRCKRTGIHGTDGIYVEDGSLEISSEKNGLRTTKKGSDGRGNLVIAGGDHRIIAGRYAFLTERGDLYIYDCSIYEKSVVSAWSVGGKVSVQSGCMP